MISSDIPVLDDRIGLWRDELKAWVPDTIFDAHIHLCSPGTIGKFSRERLKVALCTFSSLTWQEAREIYEQVFSGKRMAGAIAFPLPMREADLEGVNAYITEVMKTDPRVKGFVLSHPTDVERTITMFKQASGEGVEFSGVKPYFDLLCKSNYDVSMPEFIPNQLLAFMDREELAMMLHTSGTGMGDVRNQECIRTVLEKFPRVKVILAHMGRYMRTNDFRRFLDSGLMEYSNLFLEMSTASQVEIYENVLEHGEIWKRLLFGTDIPYGIISGTIECMDEGDPVFVTREQYPWMAESTREQFPALIERLTLNTYHTIKALKDALEKSNIAPDAREDIKEHIFCRNALGLFA